ncbi:hypothetical protein ACN23B_26725 [Anabaena sp. FACHB-709]|uniref:Uncharacterized protein n=2 Tax=Nostocaceae TaxID=1162 RepID=A0A1Z4KPT3_ANAVA|nr:MULTISPECIES: hypothetical protein [Nostocaceae]BAY70928.1 hypothetical protein NIES23_37390 [Trichormus variabilis NIES-23]HBW31674.1 hypothetical protein [Nostoc sp. UBA8866]MBD2171329.1 hypothetical protein [Anabaena cylindrica FACHB-318]MBD2263001.1 hypothetical protein [Anabaena sp. FACHB-709]MBD2272656.1 hypothetical protein [Nostoc sp. PCC 7120 = FACHB-418]
MYNLNHSGLKKMGLTGTAFGSLLIGLSTISQSAVAQPQMPTVNPCPSIFYEEPHRNRVMVPPGCPPNAATLRLQQQGQTLGQPTILVVPRRTGVRPIQPPVPESRQSAIATITPTAGTVDVKLKNNTNAGISYQAIGHTQPRYITGGQEFILRNLPTPVTITLVREDGGLLKVMPMSTSQGVLSVSLDETTNFDNNQGVLRIQRNGQVFLN